MFIPVTPPLAPPRPFWTRAAIAAAALLAAPDAARAATPVLIDGVDDDSLRAEIVRVLPDRDPPESLFEAERLAYEAAEKIRAWLRSEGWYQGAVNPVAQEAPLRARVQVRLGPRFVLAPPEIAFDGAPPDSGVAAAARTALAAAPAGAPAAAATVLTAEARALQALRAGGHPQARALERTAIVDHATQTLAVTYRFEAGPTAQLGALRIEPAGVVAVDWPLKLMTWRPGDPYTPEAVGQVRRDLRGTGVFDRVDVALAAGETGDAQDVIATVTPAPPRGLSLGAAWSTTEGAGAEMGVTRLNRFKRADTLQVDLRLAEKEQSLAADLFLPHALGRGRARRWQAELVREDAEPFARTGAKLSTAVEAARSLRFATAYGASVAADFYDARAGVENAVTVSGFADIRYASIDDPLDSRSGLVAQARVEPALSTGAASVAFTRLTAETRAFWTPDQAPRLTLAARGRAGWLQTVAGDEEDLPLERRFYAGGGGSVRGYPFRAIYPGSAVAASTEPPGGLGLVEVSLEARMRVAGPFGVAAFVDGGDAFDAPDKASPRWGAGLGLRYDLGFAPLRVDFAVPLDRQGGEAETAVYVSLGQAF